MTQTESPPDALCWRVHLALRRPRQAVVAALGICGAGALVHLGWPALPLGPVAIVLLFLSASEFFLPISYRITDSEISMRNGLTVRRLAWAQVRRCVRDAEGLLVSPLGRASRLDAFRGLYLRLPEQLELREQLLSGIARRSGETHGG